MSASRSLPCDLGKFDLTGFPTFHGVLPSPAKIQNRINHPNPPNQHSPFSNLAFSPSKKSPLQITYPVLYLCPCSATVSGFSQVIFTPVDMIPVSPVRKTQFPELQWRGGNGGRTRRRLHSLLPLLYDSVTSTF